MQKSVYSSRPTQMPLPLEFSVISYPHPPTAIVNLLFSFLFSIALNLNLCKSTHHIVLWLLFGALQPRTPAV